MVTITISVKNLGPLAEGEVELRPLTLFFGPSNTGKSYMATAIWAVTQAFQEEVPPIGMPAWAFLDDFRWPGNPQGEELSEFLEKLGTLVGWVAGLSANPFNESSSFSVRSLPEVTQREIENSIRPFLDDIRATIVDQLDLAYGPDSAFARNKRTEDFSLRVHRDKPQLKIEVRLKELEEVTLACDVSQAEVQEQDYHHYRFRPHRRDSEGELFSDAIAVFAAALLGAKKSVFAGLPANSYYLPAARSGIVQGHKVLAAAIVRRSRRAGIQPIDIPTLPGMATEFLSQMLALDKDAAKHRPPTSELSQAIAFIENEVVGGQIDFDESDGLPLSEIVYLPGPVNAPTGKYTLDQVSSMVSELAPVLLFLKYLVRPGDLIIFEEPESHLHPAAQLRLAQGIARLVKAGVKVLITTHSGDFVSRLNHLMRIANASPRWLRKNGFAPEDCLQRSQVAAYGFNFDAELAGNKTTWLEIEPDYGITGDGFDEIAHLLYEEMLLVQRIRPK